MVSTRGGPIPFNAPYRAMNTDRRVSLTQIAQEVGLTRMAVSLALRNKAGVSADTKERVLAVAAKLGYQPDPEVSNLMARIRATRPSEIKACIGLLTSGPSPPADTSVTERKYVNGVLERARAYGYSIEEFHIGPGGLTPKRAASIMWNRGIEGVILRPLQFGLSGATSRSVDFDFDRFSSVAISETIKTPDLERALHDQYTAMLTSMSRLTEMGYARIGLVLEESLNLRVNGRWSAAYMQHQLFSGNKQALPALILESADAKAFSRWWKQHKPDVIVSVNRFGLRLLESCGLQIAKDVDYASLDLDGELPEYPNMTGIDQNSHLVGAAAVDMLVVSMQRKQRGIPLHPMRIEVEGEWRNGDTTRKNPKPRR